MSTQRIFAVLFAAVLPLLQGCGGGSDQPSSESTGAEPVSAGGPVSMNKEDYTVFANPDAGADPSVPADQGGRGFTGEGWETNADFNLIGDPRAVKGGLFRRSITDFPGTLRMGGPEWNSYVNFLIGNLVYESLLTLDPATLEYIPSLATHWQVSPDKMTYRFRINPNARFSDGQSVTADDVIASWRLVTDTTLQDPQLTSQFTKLGTPVAESKYIVSVKARQLDWKNFLNFATGLMIFPASALKDVNGAAYLRDYNFKYLPNTGPYIVRPEDIQKAKSISLRRRKDYWAEKDRRNVGLNNFDEVRIVVVRDENLEFEMFKRGDLDFYWVSRSSRWLNEMDFDNVQRGLIQKRKLYNSKPDGYNGFAINTRRKPIDDIRVRKALTLLFNRALIIEKIYLNEYLPMNSYYSGTVYENPNNPKNLYNPDEALRLLAEAGWKGRDSQGRLTKDGRPLELELLYPDKGSEIYLTVYQEDLRKVGITLNLRLVTFETQFKLMNQRQFDLALVAWGVGPFPDPEIEFHSRLADVNNSGNITGFKLKRIDEICDLYARTFDQSERVALMKELDGILTNEYHYILRIHAPAERIAYWNRYGAPAGHVTRMGDYYSSWSLGPGPDQLWWVDPQKARKLEEAMRDSSLKLEVGATEDRYWLNREGK